MTCSDFLQGFSEYYDGTGSEAVRREADGHLDGCPSCRRYVEIFDRGRGLLRSFPEIEVDDDFRPRLQHRIYHLEDAEALKRGILGSASGTTAATALGMAILLVFAAWSPALWSSSPEVRLSPIVVSKPHVSPFGLPFGLRLQPYRLSPPADAPLDAGDLWRQPNSLLFQHSPLSVRTRSALRRADLE